MHILAAQPESMAGGMARALTLDSMGQQGEGLCSRDYSSFNIKVHHMFREVNVDLLPGTSSGK